MNINNLKTIEALESFILGNQAVAFTVLGDKHERYQLIQRSLVVTIQLTPRFAHYRVKK